MTWPSREDALAAAAEDGWSPSEDEAGAITDLTPAQAWLRGRLLRLPTASVLGLWGWAGDVATSTGAPWADRGGERDRIYRKLFAAEVPSFFDVEDYRPSWTAHELDAARAVVGAGVRVLRAAAHAPRRVSAACRGEDPWSRRGCRRWSSGAVVTTIRSCGAWSVRKTVVTTSRPCPRPASCSRRPPSQKGGGRGTVLGGLAHRALQGRRDVVGCRCAPHLPGGVGRVSDALEGEPSSSTLITLLSERRTARARNADR